MRIFAPLAALGALAMLPACGSTTPPTTDSVSAADAVDLQPVDALLRWLQARGQAEDTVRIPVVVQRPRDALGRGDVFIGARPDDATTLKLDLDDSRLGISLEDRLRSLCPPQGAPCTLWLTGSWGHALPGPATLPGPADGSWPFTIHTVGALVTPQDAPRASLAAPTKPHGGTKGL